jgi:hypothetical protein
VFYACSDEGRHDGGDLAAAGQAVLLGEGVSARNGRIPCVEARLAEAVAAGGVDVQTGQGQAVHADAAGEGLGAVGLVRGLVAVAGGLLLQLLDDERELGVRVGARQPAAADGLDLLLQVPNLVDVADPLRALGRAQRGAHLCVRVSDDNGQT